jgi:hypothetical protein
MIISFACPECEAKIEIGEEYAGQSGECPRCQQMIVIPSSSKPTKPILALAGATPLPPSDAEEDGGEQRKPRRRASEADAAPRRLRRARQPSKSVGVPTWVWVLGSFVALFGAGLLVISFVVLVFWRNNEPTKPAADPKFVGKVEPPMPKFEVKGVIAGRLEGRRAILQNGVFQIQSALGPGDLIDPDDEQQRCHCKIFEVEMRADKEYVLEMQSEQFFCILRIEDDRRNVWAENARFRDKFQRVTFQPEAPRVFLIYASCNDPAFGPFTLTIRETDAKRIVP